MRNLDESQDARVHCIVLQKEIDHLQQKRYKKAHIKAQAQWQMKGETICKYWSKVNSPKSPRDIIYRLKMPDSNRMVSKSEEMVEVARNYHEEIQQADLLSKNMASRWVSMRETLNNIPAAQKLNALTRLHNLLLEEHILEALRSLKSGSATRIDSIPYETWKVLHEKHIEATKSDKPSFNVVKTLTCVINDIQCHGVLQDFDFTLSWMCPLYKKKDQTLIENYCPITLLNTDYKILTKALAMQLAKEIHTLIHPDQSGFIPKRFIFDPIRLAQTMAAYADVMEEDSAILC